MTYIPDARSLTDTPLRHRLQVQLNAPVAEVWQLVGDHTRLPEYSAGIARVEMERGPEPVRTCYFHPMPGASDGMVVREAVRWSAANVGYASSALPGNAFGLHGDLSLVLLEPRGDGTLFTWEQYYDADDVDAMRASFDEGLVDIANQLVQRFGGRIVEHWVDRPVAHSA